MNTMTNKKSAEEWEDQPKPIAVRLLVMLGRVGLRTMRAKLFACALLLTGTSVALSSVLAYLNCSGALDAAGQLGHGAAGLSAGLVERIALMSLLVFAVASIPAFIMAAGLAEALRKIALTAERVSRADEDESVRVIMGD